MNFHWTEKLRQTEVRNLESGGEDAGGEMVVIYPDVCGIVQTGKF